MSNAATLRRMTLDDIPEVVGLQALAFPPPFSQNLHWDPEHLERHIQLFQEAQYVAESSSEIVGSCSNTLISEERWQAHESWGATVGGPNLRGFDEKGTTLYGLDITVHPSHRRHGIGRAFYNERFRVVRQRKLARYGTGCRLPDYAQHTDKTVEEYARRVANGELTDKTLTPLLRYGLTFLGVLRDYMDDEESANAAALLEWQP